MSDRRVPTTLAELGFRSLQRPGAGYSPDATGPEMDDGKPYSFANELTGRVTPMLKRLDGAIEDAADTAISAGANRGRVGRGVAVVHMMKQSAETANSIAKALSLLPDILSGRHNDFGNKDISNIAKYASPPLRAFYKIPGSTD